MILSPLSCINMIISGRHRFRPSSTVSQESGAPGHQTKTHGWSLPCYCQHRAWHRAFSTGTPGLISDDDGVGFWQQDHMISMLFA